MVYVSTFRKEPVNGNALSTDYIKKYQQVMRCFFSRDKRLWPLFSCPDINMLVNGQNPFSKEKYRSLS